MDGVLVDFVRGAARLFDADYDDLVRRWPGGVYDMEKVLGVSKAKFFSAIDRAGEDFWAGLPAYPYAAELYNHCAAMAPTYILSSPTLDPSSLAGKVRWLQDRFGRDFRDYILTSKKEMCASETHVLIDDHASNVAKFRKRGGHGILFPALGNSRHAEVDRRLEAAKADLERARKSIASC